MGDKFTEMIAHTEYNAQQLHAALAEKLRDVKSQDLTGKVVVVTGANAGIGYEVAKAVATMHPKLVVLACRSVERGAQALATLKEATKFENFEVMQLDLASYDSVKKFAHNFLQKGLPLDILVNNAGVAMMTPQWVTTPDGHEIQVQVNHLATMLLTLLLTPALTKSPKARVVIVSSDTHFWARRPTADDPTPIKTSLAELSPENLFMLQYPTSKLYNVLFAKEYARRCPHKNITIVSANPGYTTSELGSKDPLSGEKNGASRPNFLPPRDTYEGAKTIIDAAISPSDDVSNGDYYSEVRKERNISTADGEVGAKFGGNVWRDSIAHLQKALAGENVESWVTN